MPQRIYVALRLSGCHSKSYNPMYQYGQMMDARLQQRRQEYTRNKSIEELQRRAQGGDKLADVTWVLSVWCFAAGQAFSAYYQQMASEDRFRRQQAAAALIVKAKLQRQ